MKFLKLYCLVTISLALLTSCVVVEESIIEDAGVSPETVISDYDLWYVDYHRTTGTGTVPFLSRAFTLSFRNGFLYANNNIVDIGHTGEGLGVSVGTYNSFNGVLETQHVVDGFHDFEVFQLSLNEIRLYNYRENVSYYLMGYQKHNFDYDQLFYENIEYFLQEFVAWEKTATSGGTRNPFDAENYLQFIPVNNTAFYSSHNVFGTNVDILDWNAEGVYEVFDIVDHENLKMITLTYDVGVIESFELSIINDETISLYHINTATTYDFSGRGFIQYLKGENLSPSVRNSNRKRTKIKRERKRRRSLK